MGTRVRFLHCAGFRFDSPSWEGPEVWARQRNQDLWQTFEAVLSLSRSENVDLFFLVGNLFEQENVRKETVERVARSLGKLEGIQIFIVPGERDPLVRTSAYRLVVWPSNVHIFLGGINQVKIPSLNVSVFGAGWTAYCQEDPFLEGFQTMEDGTLQFMLLHAEVNKAKNSDKFIPITSEQIALSGLDYLALGHQEVWSGIQQAGKTFWTDCGSAEARSFRESGPHGVILGEIGQESELNRFEFRELAQRHYIEKSIPVQSDIERIAEQLLAATSINERQVDLFRIKLAGFVREEDVAEVVQSLRNLTAEKFRYIEIVPELSEWEYMGNKNLKPFVSIKNGYPTLKQLFIDNIQARLCAAGSAEDYKHWELVQKIGVAAFGQGREIDED